MTITIKQLEQLIEFLQVKPIRNKKEYLYKTSWGKKTEEGLRLSIEAILSEQS